MFTVSVGILATSHVTESPLYLPLLAVCSTAAGSWISWHRRRSKNWWIKLILALLMLLALANFLVDIAENPYDPRVPLSYLLIWLQVLHSFDLPKRKDLFYSMWVGLVLISVAATISRDLFFGGYLVAFIVLATTSLFYSNLSSHQVLKLPRLFVGRLLLPTLVLTLMSAAVAFMFIPRYEGMKIRNLPVSMRIKALPLFRGQIKNPAYPSRSSTEEANNAQGKRQRGKFDPFSYYGFSTELDLNYRGQLSDEIVMRVKSSRASYWRAMVFDKYKGGQWEMTYPFELRRLTGNTPPIYVRETSRLFKNIVPREQVTQTFFIEKDQSNLIFMAPYAEFLYFPTEYVLLDVYGGVRSPIELFHGTVYSVVSEMPMFNLNSLRRARPINASDEIDPMYLQVPANISKRVRQLTQSLVKHTQNPADAILTLQQHLRHNYPYKLDIPEFPEGRDTVDYFLFEQKAGYCEHFASSLAMMSRLLGIPSRLVTGYSSGQYNPVTGYFDVRSNDAHAWVEIYFPHHGWVPFDPTPGYEAYRGEQSIYQDTPSRQFWSYFMDLIPKSWKTFIQNMIQGALQGFATVLGALGAVLLYLAGPLLSLMVGIIICAVLVYVYWQFRRQQKTLQEPPMVLHTYATDPAKKQVIDNYLALLQKLEQHFHIPAGPTEHLTAWERQQRLHIEPQGSSILPHPLESYTRLYYSLRYSSLPCTAEVMAQTQRWEQEILTGLPFSAPAITVS